MFNQLGAFADLMRNAGKIREGVEKAGEALGNLRVDGDAGGGAVSAQVNGRLELLSVKIDPKLLDGGDAELLEELVVAAVNQAMGKAREAAARSLSGLAGGLPIPDLSALLNPGAGGGK